MSRRYSHLTEADRLLVQVHLSQGESQNSIAKRIGCSASTISRELARARAHTGHLDRYFVGPAKHPRPAQMLAMRGDCRWSVLPGLIPMDIDSWEFGSVH